MQNCRTFQVLSEMNKVSASLEPGKKSRFMCGMYSGPSDHKHLRLILIACSNHEIAHLRTTFPDRHDHTSPVLCEPLGVVACIRVSLVSILASSGRTIFVYDVISSAWPITLYSWTQCALRVVFVLKHFHAFPHLPAADGFHMQERKFADCFDCQKHSTKDASTYAEWIKTVHDGEFLCHVASQCDPRRT